MEETIRAVINKLSELKSFDEKVEAINKVKLALHEISPFKSEPVDCVIWVKHEFVKANDYNPNAVAPPEMELLKLSVLADGYTQPIVAYPRTSFFEVVDGFHRNRVGREVKEIKERLYGYLPITQINVERASKGDRIATTIRHNRARGKHQIELMSQIVLELRRRNWSSKKIGKHLGMDSDEILRLSQITGLAEMFKDKEFSKAWESDLSVIDETDTLEVESDD